MSDATSQNRETDNSSAKEDEHVNPEPIRGFGSFENSEQDTIIRLAPEERTVVNAGPGTGKTYTLIEKIIYMINDLDVEPERILILCFSRAAVEVIKERLEQAVEDDRVGHVWQRIDIRTFDAYITYLIFADPDNGISFSKNPKTKDSEKYILPEEIREYYDSGKNVVFYCHKGRRKAEEWEHTKEEIRSYVRDAQILAVTCHKGTQRSYIFVLHPDCYLRYAELLEAFLKTEWNAFFTREPVRGNALSAAVQDNYQPKPLQIEAVSIPFSVCKVSDYEGISLAEPFVFSGSTDQEKSLP